MYKTIINPTYKALSSFINQIPDTFERSGKTIYTGRNLIKVFEVNGLKINVKRYGVPFFLNRIVYSFFRKSKGLRAYEYPFVLEQKKIATPEPIAYIEERKGGLIHYSYFISIQSSYKSLLYDIGNSEAHEIAPLLTALAKFTTHIHENEVYHKDYSPGNILVDKREDGSFDFCLVDINRMKFGPVSIEVGCSNFARLWGQPSSFEFLAEEYARLRGGSLEQCKRNVMRARNKFWRRVAKKRGVKYNLKFE